MPNGFYPVPGLDVLCLHRTEQRYPRIEWNQAWDRCWIAVMNGPKGYAPLGPLHLPSHSPSFDEVVEATRGVLVGDPELSHTSASVLWLDFKTRTGCAVGSFCAYGFKQGHVQILHDLTIGAQAPREVWSHIDPVHLEHSLVYIEPTGIKSHRDPQPSLCFGFADRSELVVSSVPLHYSSHWPPKNGLDLAMIALCRSERRDQVLALWKDDEAAAPQR